SDCYLLVLSVDTSGSRLAGHGEVEPPHPTKRVIKPDLNLLLNNSFELYSIISLIYLPSAARDAFLHDSSSHRPTKLQRRHTIMVCDSSMDGKLVPPELPPLEEEEEPSPVRESHLFSSDSASRQAHGLSVLSRTSFSDLDLSNQVILRYPPGHPRRYSLEHRRSLTSLNTGLCAIPEMEDGQGGTCSPTKSSSAVLRSWSHEQAPPPNPSPPCKGKARAALGLSLAGMKPVGGPYHPGAHRPSWFCALNNHILQSIYQTDYILWHSNRLRRYSKRWQSPVECLSLTLEEVTHIRSVLTKAELESLISHPDLYQQVSKSKLCFTCKTTRFSLFGEWGTKCKFCKRTVCSKCLRKMNVPDDQFKHIPVYTLSASPLTPEMQEVVHTLTRASPAPPIQLAAGSNLDRNQTLSEQRQLPGHRAQPAELVPPSKDDAKPSKGFFTRSKPLQRSQSLCVPGQKPAPELAQTPRGPAMAICCDCKGMVKEIIRATQASLAVLSSPGSSVPAPTSSIHSTPTRVNPTSNSH
ncbi:unnamed protein product, partial [Candidula unifasciata]